MTQAYMLADKAELLEVLERNRGRHRRVFEAALSGYAAKLGEELEARLDALSHGRIPDRVIHLIEPQDHTDDYDAVITMVKMHQGATFPLNEDNFRMYVMDQWNWRKQWALSNSSYAEDVFAMEYGAGA